MGQVVAYLPEWYSAAPTVFKSNNPLIISVTLDMYTIISDSGDGEKTQIPVVTHQSLLNWYRSNMLRFGIRKSVEMVTCTPDTKVVRCILDSTVLGHTESLGEASANNLATRISLEHPNSMAENRAFDRAIMDYLALDTPVYSSSDEIRGSSQPSESKEYFTRAPASKPASAPSIQKAAVQTAAPPAPVPQPLTTAQAPIPQAPAAPRPDPLLEIRENPFPEEDVQWLLSRTLNLYNSVYNGKNIGLLLDKLFRTPDMTERGELAKTFYKYMRIPVRGDTEKAKEIKVLKYYLFTRNVLAVSREGSLYINMDKPSESRI